MSLDDVVPSVIVVMKMIRRVRCTILRWAVVGDAYKNVALLLEAGLADRMNLYPIYQQLYSAIREADPDRIVFYEPAVLESYLGQGTGFTTGPGGPSDNDRQALSIHLYCANQNSTGDITNVTICEDSLQGLWSTANSDFVRVGGGRMMTEFGAVGAHESSSQVLTFLTDLADQGGMLSWTYWTWKSFQDITTQNPASESLYNDDGSLQMLKLAALSRSYPQAVPASPGTLRSHFDWASPQRTLTITFTVSTTARNTSAIVFVNRPIHYPAGLQTTLDPAGAGVIVDTGGPTIRVDLDDAARGSEVTITVTAN